MTTLKRTKTYVIASASLTGIALFFALIPPPAPRVGELSIIVRKPPITAHASVAPTATADNPPEIAYDIARVRAGELDVPHIFLASLPADLVSVPSPAMRAVGISIKPRVP